MVWHMGLVVKLYRMQIPIEILKILNNWLTARKAYIVFGSAKSDAFSTHIFADDLSTLVVPPIQKHYQEMLKFINSAGSRVCQSLFEYSVKWKQPINVNKTVVQIFHSQVKIPEVEILMNNTKLETVKTFKYLGFEWSNKMSLKTTVHKCLENIQKSYCKLKWLDRNNDISIKVLRTCFFALFFSFFTWIFPFFPLIPAPQQKRICSKI
jgi:hypothetical protein